MKFDAQQSARSILITFHRGNYALAVSRLRQIEPLSARRAVADIISVSLTADERKVWAKYWKAR